MSAPAFPTERSAALPAKPTDSAKEFSLLAGLDVAMQAIASLKLTVTLFALGIFVVFVGTLAQTEADIWQVVRDYFHAWVMWVDVNLLFPKSFFPDMPHIDAPPFPAPGGMTVGVLMALNLVAAHTWRFKIQTAGSRLFAGLGVIALGLLLTALVIFAGHNDQGFNGKPPFSWDSFWIAFLVVCGGAWIAGMAAYAYKFLGPGARDSAFTWIRLTNLVAMGTLLLGVAAALGWGIVAKQRPSDEALRIVWQLFQGGLAGIVLLVGCIMVFQKRGGIVLLHAGIGLLMVNELLVARQAVEWQIFLQEGQSTNYLRDIRTVELAIIAPADAKSDEHTVVPRHLLERNLAQNRSLAKQGKPSVKITHELLPFDIQVLEYYRNSDVEAVKADEENLATAGRGLKEKLVALPAAKGTDTGGAVDFAGAYVKLTDKQGQDLGTYLLSQLASEQKDPERFAEKVAAGGEEYKLFLRFKRNYLGMTNDPATSRPFTVSLVDVRKDDYVASDTPRNYSSDVRLVDPASGVDQPVHIKMNDPLRYRSLTFYQSGYNVTPDGEATTLAVVRNRIWMIPYVACAIVAIGMCAHFLLTVGRFVSRRQNEELAAGGVVRAELADGGPAAKKPAKEPARGINWSQLGLPALAVALFFVIVSYGFRPPRTEPDEMDLAHFGRLPVAHGGRVKPLDSLARNTLQAISNREYVKLKVKDEETGKENTKKIPAIQWLLEVITGSEESQNYEVVRIEHPELLQLFDLPERPLHYRYSIAELKPQIEQFIKQVEAARKLRTEDLTLDQRKLIELDGRLKQYMLIVEAFGEPRLPPLPTPEELQTDQAAAKRKLDMFKLVIFENSERLKQMKAPQVIPLSMPEGTPAEQHWHPYPAAVTKAFIQTNVMGEEADAATVAFNKILAAYQDKKVDEFNLEVARYEALLAKEKPPLYAAQKMERETTFNRAAPFTLGGMLYLCVFLLAIFGWLFRYQPLNWAAFTLLALTVLFHTAALWMRIDISGRPPVTNLYSTAVFIGWACAVFGLVIEAIYRIGLGNVLSAVAGFATLLIAGLLASGGDDTVGVMQAVLDTQFWLATHVLTINLGYAATAFAGLFGLIYVLLGVCTPVLDQSMRQILGRIIYGITCFAILFSFVGTVLGGLWADDSWGRFWGWDPKENGALMIVLWNALVLHARWDKMIADRGLAVLAIGGNIFTAWSWFGVNQLGIGLHSYGFTSGIVLALMVFGAYMLVCIAFGSLPLGWWWSRQPPGKPTNRSVAVGISFLVFNALFLSVLGYQAYAALT